MWVNSMNAVEQVLGTPNLYRLFGTGVTPNGCWVVNPEMRELADIDVATGKDVYGSDVLEFDCCGTVNASGRSFILTERKD